MSDVYELFVRWYLRFNGYLSVENFVVHEAVEEGNRQGGETDILAVRFPFSRELPGFRIENDARLLDEEAKAKKLTDFIVAEVKGGSRDLNRLWRPPTDNEKRGRTEYLVRWLGFCQRESAIRSVATQLQNRRRAKHKQNLVRVVYFGAERRPQVEALGVLQITHKDIAEFFVNTRARCWFDQRLGVRSPHNQWHPLIREVWGIADPQRGVQDKVGDVLDFLESEQAAAAAAT